MLVRGADGVVPQLLVDFFADPLVGFAFAAIVAANLFTRNFYQEFIRQDISSTEETTVSRIGSTIVLIGALIWVLSAPNYAITLQLAGGVWILQTLPAVFLGLYVGWLDRWAVVVGWLVGMVWGTYGMIQGGFDNGGLAPPEPLGFATPLYV